MAKVRKNKPNGRRRVEYRTMGVVGGMDYILLFCVIMLVFLGIIMVFSSSFYADYKNAKGQGGYGFLTKECIFAACGTAAMLLISKINHTNIMRYVKILYFAIVILLVLVLFIGEEINGAKRWINVAGFNLQPSEFAKPITVMALATMVYRDKNLLNTLSGTAKYITVLALPLVLIAKENLSTAIVLCAIAIAMMFVATKKWWYILGIIAIGAFGAFILVLTAGFRMERVAVWRNPAGSDSATAYQVLQSLYSVASGGIFGLGAGASRQKLGFLPEAHNDIIFAVVCEELGLVGSFIISVLFVLLVWRGYVAALQHKDNMFSMLVSVGLTTMVAIQALINMAVVTNTIPNTGVTLPFISYGGSSLIAMLMSMGILLNITRYRKL